MIASSTTAASLKIEETRENELTDQHLLQQGYTDAPKGL